MNLNDIKMGNDEFFLNSTLNFDSHQNKPIITLSMPYEQAYQTHLKSLIPLAKWSASKKYWYVNDTQANRKILQLNAKVYSGKELLRNIHQNNQGYLNTYINTLRLMAYSENTIKTYSIEFAQWLYVLGSFSVEETNPDQLKSYLLYCMNDLGLSENQMHSRLNALKFFYEKVLKQESFFFEIPRPKKKSALPKVLSTQEITRLFDVTDNVKHKLILKIAYGLGLRVSEIATLKIRNIDSGRMLVHIENAKGKKDRYVPLPTSILSELREYYKQYLPKTYLFEGTPNNPLALRTVQAVFKNAMNKARITKKVGIHGLRHSYATHLLEYGTDMSFIQKLLGHNNIKTTEVYAKVSNTFLSKITSPLDFLNKNTNNES